MQNFLSVSLKKLSIYTVISLSFLIPSQVMAATDDILGDWYNSSKESKIQIYKTGDKYFGKLVWLKEPTKNGKIKKDEKNPDKLKQNIPILGLVILRDFKNISDTKWQAGKIYDPRNGKEYSSELTLKSSKTLDVRGYIGISILGRSDTWTKS